MGLSISSLLMETHPELEIRENKENHEHEQMGPLSRGAGCMFNKPETGGRHKGVLGSWVM